MEKAAKLVPYAFALLFFWSGAYKAADPSDAASALEKFGASAMQAVAVTLLAAIIELHLAMNLLRQVSQERYVRFSVYLLGIFTAFLVAIKARGVQSCGCTGLEPLFAGFVDPGTFGIVRNILMILAAECYLWHNRESGTSRETGEMVKSSGSG